MSFKCLRLGSTGKYPETVTHERQSMWVRGQIGAACSQACSAARNRCLGPWDGMIFIIVKSSESSQNLVDPTLDAEFAKIDRRFRVIMRFLGPPQISIKISRNIGQG